MSRRVAEAGAVAPVVLALNGSVISLRQGVGAALGGMASGALGMAGLPVAGLLAAFVTLTLQLWAVHSAKAGPPVADPYSR